MAEPDTNERRRPVVMVVLAVAASVWAAATWADRAERVLTLEIECEGPECTARVGDVETTVPVAGSGFEGGRIGAYVYHSWEFDRPQYFRDLRTGDGFQLPLTDPGSIVGWETEPGWSIVRDRGMTHRGAPGVRSIAMLDRVRVRDFRLSVDLVHNVDSGVLLRAKDSRNGTVVVARSGQNDLFFFELRDGEVGPIEGLVALRPLSTARESLRLAGLGAQLLLLAAGLFLVLRWLAVAAGPRASTWGAAWLAHGSPPVWWVPSLALAGFVALASVASFASDAVPHLADETAYLFQAKVFAGGALWAPPPDPVEFFKHEHIVITADRWFGKYPPLFPALLAVGVRLGAPALVNPLLGAVMLVVIWWLTRELTDWRWATVAALLTLSSPFFLVMGGTMMSHVASALFVTGFLYCFLRAVGRATPSWGLAAGGCLAALLWTRPFTALLVTLCGAVYGTVVLVRATERRTVARSGVAVALVLLPATLGFLAWNGLHTDGKSLAIGLHDAYSHADRLGFGPDRGSGWLKTWGSWGHTPAKALRSAATYLDYTSNHFLGWPLRLSLGLALAGLLFRRGRSGELLLWSIPLALVTGHMFYWATQHIGYGARYWFAALPALIVLTTIGLRNALDTASDGAPRLSWGVAVLLALLLGWNLTTYLPVRLAELEQYGGVTADLHREVERRGLDRAVVLIPTEGLLYNDGFFMNDPFLREGPVFVRDLGERNVELVERFPDRPLYRWSSGRLEPLSPPAESMAVAR